VKDAGFLYDSSLMASDDAYEILLDKQPTGVVELPIERIVDDFPYFGGATNGGMPNPIESSRCSGRSSTSRTTKAGSSS
jgi:hypothetical protein